MDLSWFRFRRAGSLSTSERIDLLRQEIARFECQVADALNGVQTLFNVAEANRQTSHEELEKKIEVVRALVDNIYYSLSAKFDGLDENQQDLLFKIAHVSSGLFGGSAQEWLRKYPREPREFDYERRQ